MFRRKAPITISSHVGAIIKICLCLWWFILQCSTTCGRGFSYRPLTCPASKELYCGPKPRERRRRCRVRRCPPPRAPPACPAADATQYCEYFAADELKRNCAVPPFRKYCCNACRDVDNAVKRRSAGWSYIGGSSQKLCGHRCPCRSRLWSESKEFYWSPKPLPFPLSTPSLIPRTIKSTLLPISQRETELSSSLGNTAKRRSARWPCVEGCLQKSRSRTCHYGSLL